MCALEADGKRARRPRPPAKDIEHEVAAILDALSKLEPLLGRLTAKYKVSTKMLLQNLVEGVYHTLKP